MENKKKINAIHIPWLDGSGSLTKEAHEKACRNILANKSKLEKALYSNSGSNEN